jgi:hypothetical protein
MEHLAGILVGVLTGFISALLWYVWQAKVAERIKVRRLTRLKDEEVGGVLELYSTLFPEEDGANYSMAEVSSFIGAPTEQGHHIRVENIVLAATFKRAVVGFLFAHYYPSHRKAIISYLGIDKQVLEARQAASPCLLRKMRDILRKLRCEYVFYDLLGIDSTLQQEVRKERRGLPILFRQAATTLGTQAHEFQFPYTSPRVSLGESTREFPSILACVSLQRPLPAALPKATVLDFLRFIYLDCYGDLYPTDDPRFEEHQAYLRRLLDQYEATLPSHVKVA